MKTFMVALFVSSLATWLQADLTIDQILERHIAARDGIEKIKATRTLVYSAGDYREGVHDSHRAFMALARPYYKVVGGPRGRLNANDAPQ